MTLINRKCLTKRFTATMLEYDHKSSVNKRGLFPEKNKVGSDKGPFSVKAFGSIIRIEVMS